MYINPLIDAQFVSKPGAEGNEARALSSVSAVASIEDR